MTNAVATVAFIQGQAWAKAADGTMRPLSLGAVLNEGEIVVTAQGARVELEFGQGDTIAINGGQEVAMSRDLNLQTATTEDEAKLDDGSVQQAMTVLNQGGDLLDNLEETAAGSTGSGSSGNEGHDFVQLTRVLEQTDPQSFQFSSAEQPALNQPSDTGQNLLANQAPDVGNQNLSVDEDQVLFGRVDASDLEGEPLTYGINSAPLHGTLELNTATGQFVYTPNADYNGADSFSVTVTDGHGNTSIGQVSVGVNPVNDAPATRDLELTTNEDTPISGQVVAGDVDGDSLSYALTTNPANGSLVLNPNTGAFTYTPNANYNGSDSFVITVSDGQGGTTTSTVAVGVAPVNDAPVTSDQNISTQEDTPVTGNIVATDVDGDSLSYSLSTTPSHGTLVLNPATGAYTYTPTANYNGSDSFVVTISDGQGGTTTSSVSVGITPVNDAPVASDQNLSTSEDTPVSGSINASDVDGDSLTFTTLTAPTHGTLNLNSATGAFTYTPSLNYNGSDSFVVTVSDGQGGTTTSTVVIGVAPANDAPTSSDQNLSTNEDTAVAGQVVAADLDGDTLSYSISQQPTHGNLAFSQSTGKFTYTPGANYNGSDSFVVTISDGKGGTTTSTINIAVNPVNDVPVSADQNLTTDEDVAKSGTVVASDIDGDSLSFAVSTTASHGSVALNSTTGEFTYTPDANYNGSDSFVVTISDGKGGTTTSTINIAVNPANDAPVSADQNLTTDEDVAKTGTVVATDIDGDSLSYSVSGAASHGNVVLNTTTGEFTYTPDANYNGSDSFVVTISDGKGGTTTSTINIAVNPVNDAPVSADQNLTTDEDVAKSGTVVASDIDGDSLSYSVSGAASHGNVVLNTTTGEFTYTPSTSYNGTDSFVVTISDGKGGTTTSTINISVGPVNDAPISVADNISVNEGGTATVLVGGASSVLANDSDAESDPLTAILVSSPAHGTLTLNTDGTFSYTHDGSETTSDSFSYRANDGTENGNVVTVNIAVTPVNDAPVAVNDSSSVNEGDSIVINLAGNDTDADNALDLTSIQIVSGPANGSITVNADGTVSYQHNGSETTSDSFTYTIKDASGAVSNVATVNLTVNPVNDAPVTVADRISVNEGGTATVLVGGATSVLTNDSDAESDPLSAILVSGPAHGTLTLNTDGTFSYTHDGSETTSDSFSYRANDGTENGNLVTVNIAVTPVNDAPVAVDDSSSVNEGDSVVINLATNDTDADNALDLTSIQIVSGPANGSITVNADGTVNYQHNGSETTADSFTYTIKDASGAVSNVATVNLTVNPINDAPVAVNDSSSVNEGDSVVINLAGNDTDADNALDLTSIQIISGPANGSITINADGTVSYQHNGSETTSDSFTYTIKDASGATSNVATVNLTVNPVNDAPVSVADSISVNEGGTATVLVGGATSVLTNDSDAESDPLSAILVAGPAHGTLTLNTDGTFSYTHDGSETTSDSFSYRANDGTVNGNVVTVNIAVTPVNDAPVAVDDSRSVNEGDSIVINLAGNDTDADNVLDLSSIQIISGPANGSITVNADGTVSYQHDGSETTADSFTYTIKDASGAVSNVATVNLTVTPVNDAPVAVNDSSSVNEGDSVVINLAGNDTDADNALDLTSIQIVSGPANGSITVNADGTVSYQHNGSETTTDSFSYTIKDASGATSNVATVNLTVNPVNDAPVSVADSISVNEGGTATVLVGGATSVLTNDSDAESDPLSAILVSGPAHGTLTLNTDGTFSYTHDGSETTSDSFSYRANDGTENGNVVTVNIAVTPVNDAPVAVNDSSSVNEGDSVVINLAGNDADADNTLDLTSIQIVSGPANGSVTVNADGTVNYQHNGSETTADSFTYTIKDASGAVSNVATVNLTVNPVNDVPVAVADSISVNEGGTATVLVGGATSVLTNDSDAESDPLSAILVAGPAHGTLTLNTDGTFSYTHDGSETTSDSFSYRANDGTVNGNVVTVNIAVTPVNDAPVAVDDSRSVNEGDSIVINLAGNDTDADNALDLTSIQIVSGPANGSITVNADGTVNYQHNGSETTADSFTYTIKDASGATSNVATVNLSVNPVNDGPVAVADSISVNEGGTATVLVGGATSVLTNDSDAESDPLTAVLVSGPAHGTLTLNTDGTFSYTHDGSETTSDSFSYRANDGTENGNLVTVNIAVTPVNDAPVAVNDSSSVNEGDSVVINLATNDTDADNALDLTSIQIVSGPANGSITVNADGTVSYQHNGSETTSDSFTYTIKDASGATSNVATVNLTVNPVNDAPVAVADSISVNEGGTATVLVGGATSVLTNDSDAESDPLSAILVAGPAHGTLTLNTDGTFSYTHDGSETTSDSFTYRANDGTVDGNVVTVNVAVTPQNDAPVAVNDPSNANYSINLGATSSEFWTNLSDKGVSIVYYRANGTVGYGYERPADHALGVLGSPRTDTPTVTYQIEYDQTSGTSESIGMTFSKGLLNHAVFGVSNLFPGEDGGEIGFWQAYYNGVVVASDTFRLTGTSDKGEFTIDTGDIVFDSVRFYALNTNNGTGDGGDYHVTYFQGTGITSTAGSYLVSEGGTLTIDSSSSSRLISNDTDADSDSLTVSKINGVAITDGQSITLASGATLVIHTDGSFSYSANSAFNSLDQGKLATDSFTYTIADGHGGTSTATASVSVVGTGAALSTVGTSGNDTIVGTAGADLMIGGAGNDTLSGSVGADTFKWSLGDQGSAGTPAVDTITGFSKSQGDMLDISDLLQGENASNLTDYLHFTYDSTSKATTLHISSGGGYSGGYTSSSTDQQIVLNGINLVNSSSDSDIITQLKAAGYLITN